MNYAKAFVPILPLVLLFLVSPPTAVLPFPEEWLVASAEAPGLFSSRLVGAAMLVGFAVATAISLIFDGGWKVMSSGRRGHSSTASDSAFARSSRSLPWRR